jgi:uracil-DNA glycosylase family 4
MIYTESIFHNCDESTGGSPKCRLATLRDKDGSKFAKTIQLKGAALSELIIGERQYDWVNREYDVMIVGEAPGASEDARGMPFVGRAGKILQEFATKAGLDVSRVYVTNIVKCRPPKNRKPSSEELSSCRIHIDHEIKNIQPKVIVLLGNSPLKLFNLDKQGGITSVHGKLFEKKLPTWADGPTFKVVPTFHPAFFIHRPNPKMQERTVDDYVFIKNVLEKGSIQKEFYKCKYSVVDTLPDLVDMVGQIKANGLFAFDTESCGLDFRNDPMILSQYSIGVGKNWVVPMYRHDPEGLDWKLKPQWTAKELPEVKRLLGGIYEDPEVAQIAHNIKYDINVIRAALGLETKGWLWDTCSMHHVLDSNPPHKLELLADAELGTGDYDTPVNDIVGHGKKKNKTFDHIPDDIFHQYGATDAENTYRLFYIYHNRMGAKPHLMKLYAEEVHPAFRTLAKAEWMGNKINTDVLDAYDEEIEKDIERLTAECRALTRPDFNPGSTVQVGETLQSMGFSEDIEALETATGYTTDENKLMELEAECPLAGKVLEYRGLKKIKSTYLDVIRRDIDDEDRIRYSFNLTGTVNGRLSCQLLHQIHIINEERLKEGKPILRDLFGEDSDFYYFFGDYSQIELKIFAILTREQKLLDLLAKGEDIHAATAAAALGLDPNNKDYNGYDYNRVNVGKRINFGIIFGSRGYNLSRGDFICPTTGKHQPIGWKRANNMVQSFRREYRKVGEYLDSIPDMCRAQGNVLRSVFGRERWFPSINDREKYLREAAEREAVNFTIQSPAGGITLRTLNLIDAAMEEHGVGLDKVRLINTVHDSMAYGVHKDYLEWFCKVFKIIAERPIPELDNHEFKVEYGWSPVSWTKAELAAKGK